MTKTRTVTKSVAFSKTIGFFCLFPSICPPLPTFSLSTPFPFSPVKSLNS